ncbi:MAG: SPASM domain-containing protein [Magnetococcales bacterium]|nr:SPASM domain-containing protein [Magnetococcales bacterium]
MLQKLRNLFRSQPAPPRATASLDQAIPLLKERLQRQEPFQPRIIQLETRSRCTGHCSFCLASVGRDPRPDLLMSETLFDKILGELVQWEFVNRLSLYNNNEPLMDKRITDWLRKARKALPLAYLELKSNGTILSMDKIIDLFDAGLDMLYINDYRDAEAFAKGEHRPNVARILKELEASRRFKGHFERNHHFRRVIVSLRKQEEHLNTRAGSSPNRDPLPAPLNLPCLRPFEQLAINPAGLVTLCCDDLLFQEPLGDLNQQTLPEIWLSSPYDRLRLALLEGQRGVRVTCSHCDFRGYSHEMLAELGV